MAIDKETLARLVRDTKGNKDYRVFDDSDCSIHVADTDGYYLMCNNGDNDWDMLVRLDSDGKFAWYDEHLVHSEIAGLIEMLFCGEQRLLPEQRLAIIDQLVTQDHCHPDIHPEYPLDLVTHYRGYYLLTFERLPGPEQNKVIKIMPDGSYGKIGLRDEDNDADDEEQQQQADRHLMKLSSSG